MADTPVPRENPRRQPIHTVYGGAHLFTSDTAAKLGAMALRALREHAADAPALAEALGLDAERAAEIYPRVIAKLEREPIEDYRIDFEDGFGARTDEEEDRAADDAAAHVAAGLQRGTLPPAIGIRVKPLDEVWKDRSLRTLDLFLARLVRDSGGALPPAFVVTLPKVTAPEQTSALASACETCERRHAIEPGAIKIELMIETTRSIVGADGQIALPRLVVGGRGRVVAAHFGAYDYTAACDITAAHQHMRHPACDFARHMMQVALAGTGVALSDGATNIMPIGPHRGAADRPLTAAERGENRRVVHHAWRLHADHVRHALVNGFYQGWDLHPAQIPPRLATVYAFFLEGLEAASERLRHFVGRAAQATRVRDVFDDEATGQGLLNYFVRAVSCGALSEEEAVARSGLTLAELHTRSFARILGMRNTKGKG